MMKCLISIAIILVINCVQYGTSKPHRDLKDKTFRREQVPVPRTHLVHGQIETKEAIIVLNKHANTEDKKFEVLHVPVMESKRGTPFEMTAKENGESYLTGPALRILSKNNKYDEKHPFVFFPLLKTRHLQG